MLEAERKKSRGKKWMHWYVLIASLFLFFNSIFFSSLSISLSFATFHYDFLSLPAFLFFLCPVFPASSSSTIFSSKFSFYTDTTNTFPLLSTCLSLASLLSLHAPILSLLLFFPSSPPQYRQRRYAFC